MMRRLPKFGFSNVAFETAYDIFNVSQLEKLGKEVTPESLAAAGLLKHGRVKILGNGKIEKAVTVRAHKFSAKAKEAIEKAGGKAEVIA
jgi:large subunit ribosomal protein L15